MTRFLLSLLVALVALPAFAQSPVAPSNTITVAGEGRVAGAPDQAVVRLGVTTRAATAAEALREHEADMARVLTRVREFGIADRDIQIEALSLGEHYGPNGPDGFAATRIVSVTTDDLRRVPELVAAVVGEGANRLDGLVYTIRDERPAMLQALDLAVADARAKAERLATASGVRLGRVLSVQETPIGGRPPMPMYRMAADAAVEANPAAYSAGSTRVEAHVVVTFEIAP